MSQNDSNLHGFGNRVLLHFWKVDYFVGFMLKNEIVALTDFLGCVEPELRPSGGLESLLKCVSGIPKHTFDASGGYPKNYPFSHPPQHPKKQQIWTFFQRFRPPRWVLGGCRRLARNHDFENLLNLDVCSTSLLKLNISTFDRIRVLVHFLWKCWF